MAIITPVNIQTVNLDHKTTGGSNATFDLALTYKAASSSSYIPQWDYGTGVVDSGESPASRALASVSGSTSIELMFATFAADDVDVSDIGMNATGVNNLLTALANVDGSSINYSEQDLLENTDDENPTAATNWATLETAGWSRIGEYTAGELDLSITVGAGDTHTMLMTYKADTLLCVDWGDGNIEQYLSILRGDLDHTYVSAGTYRIRVWGYNLQAPPHYNNSASAPDVVQLHRLRNKTFGSNLNNFCRGCTNLTTIDANAITDVENVISTRSMFFETAITQAPSFKNFTSIISTVDTFRNCTSLTTIEEPFFPPAAANWNDSSNMFSGCVSLMSFPDFSQITAGTGPKNITRMFLNCSLVTTPPDWSNLSRLTNITATFQGCTGLTSIGITSTDPLSNITTAIATWQNCSGLLSANISALTGLTNSISILRNTPNITTVTLAASYPSLTSSGSMFSACGITSIDLTVFPALINANAMFRQSSMAGVVNIPPNFLTITNAGALFRQTNITGVTGLTNLANSTTFLGAFFACTNLTGTLDVSTFTNAIDVTGAFNGCDLTDGALTGLTNAGLTSLSTFCFNNTSFANSLVSFDTSVAPNATNWDQTFRLTNVTAAYLDSWLIELDARGLTNGNIRYDANTSNNHLDSARSAAATTAFNNLLGKGWSRVGSYV